MPLLTRKTCPSVCRRCISRTFHGMSVGGNVTFEPLPRPPCAPWQRKISHSPDPTAPKVGGVPQSQHFRHPHFSNHAKLAARSDTFNMGVTCFAFMLRKDNIRGDGWPGFDPLDDFGCPVLGFGGRGL